MEDNELIDPKYPPYPPRPDFWRALLLVFRRLHFYDVIVVHSWCPEKYGLSDEVVEAIRTLECWLGIARQDGWLEDQETEV